MAPWYKMPRGEDAARSAARAELQDAVAAVRCALRLVGCETARPPVPELLELVGQQLVQIEHAVRRLG